MSLSTTRSACGGDGVEILPRRIGPVRGQQIHRIGQPLLGDRIGTFVALDDVDRVSQQRTSQPGAEGRVLLDVVLREIRLGAVLVPPEQKDGFFHSQSTTHGMGATSIVG